MKSSKRTFGLLIILFLIFIQQKVSAQFVVEFARHDVVFKGQFLSRPHRYGNFIFSGKTTYNNSLQNMQAKDQTFITYKVPEKIGKEPDTFPSSKWYFNIVWISLEIFNDSDVTLEYRIKTDVQSEEWSFWRTISPHDRDCPGRFAGNNKSEKTLLFEIKYKSGTWLLDAAPFRITGEMNIKYKINHF